jgi:cell division protein FtsB
MAEVKGEVAEVRRNLDLATTVAALRRQLDELAAEVAELKRRAS